MPTKRPRVSLIKDPELERALTLARANAELSDLSEGALVRALALRGADGLDRSDGMRDVRRALVRAGAALQSADLLAVSREIRTRSEPHRGQESITDTLEWVRGDR